jgi:hypothetical protein
MTVELRAELAALEAAAAETQRKALKVAAAKYNSEAEVGRRAADLIVSLRAFAAPEPGERADLVLAALVGTHLKEIGEGFWGMPRPPGGVDDVVSAIIVLLANASGATDIACTRKGVPKDTSWKAAQLLMKDVVKFRDRLRGLKDLIDTDQVPTVNFEHTRPYLALEHFTYEAMVKKAKSAALCCQFVIEIVAHYDSRRRIRSLQMLSFSRLLHERPSFTTAGYIEPLGTDLFKTIAVIVHGMPPLDQFASGMACKPRPR